MKSNYDLILLKTGFCFITEKQWYLAIALAWEGHFEVFVIYFYPIQWST